MKYNYELVTIAREAIGLTQKQLAELVKVEQGTISKIEKGLLSNDDIVKKIADELDFPVTFFYQDWTPIRVEGHYRKKVSLPVKMVKECKAKMTLVEHHITALIDSIELPKVNYPKWDVEMDGSPSICAKYVREYWRMAKGRVENLTKTIEDNGIIIVELDLDEMDGFSTFGKDGLPIIFVNSTRPGDRDLFNKAHELGHFVMHFGQKISEGRDIDIEANEFASELLLPLHDVESYFTKLTIDKLADMKRYWKISMQAIISKAKRSGNINQDQYEYIWRQMGAAGYRKKEPVVTPREKATLFQEIISAYLEDLQYTKEELCKVLQFNERKMDEWYFHKPVNKLKLIRKIA
jgi:Zn-dependent peptidase ImmA (M78 family)/transcriptional regulator with XRE-family HTH domain